MLVRALVLSVLQILILMPVRAELDLADERVENLDDCDRLVHKYPRELEAYRCYWALALRKQQQPEAVRRLEGLLTSEPRNPWALYYLGNLVIEQGDHEKAEALERLAVEGCQREKDFRCEAFARGSLFYLLERDGRRAEAEGQLEKAAAAASASGYLDVQAEIEARRGGLATTSLDYGRAWRIYKRAEDLAFPKEPLPASARLGPRASQVRVKSGALSGLGHVCWATSRYQLALQYYRREADLLHANGAFYDEVIPRYNIAFLAFNSPLNRGLAPEDVRRLISDALEAALRAGHKRLESSTRLLWGQFLAQEAQRSDSPDLAEPIRQMKLVVTLSRKFGRMTEVCYALRALSKYLLEQDPTGIHEAFELADEAVRQARESGLVRELVWMLHSRSRLFARMGERQKAIADELLAIEAAEKLRDHQIDSLVRARTFTRFSGVYTELFNYLLYAPDTDILASGPTRVEPTDEELEMAFRVAERMRSRVLLDELDVAGATSALAPPGPLAETRDEILRQITRAQRRLLTAGLTPKERGEILQEIERLELQESGLVEALARAHPTFAELREPDFSSLKETQQALDEQEAMFFFQLREKEHSWLLVLTRDHTTLHLVPGRAGLEEPLKLFLGLLDRRDRFETTGATRLYQDLLKEAIESLPSDITDLILVPDGILHRLPWCALRAHPGESILEDYRISVVPSATLWKRWRQGTPPVATSRILALADPLPPFLKGSGGDGIPAVRGWEMANELRLGPLPDARTEGRAISRRLGSESLVLTGEDATESFLKQATLDPYRIVHFAAHSVLDDEQPARTAILLSPGSTQEDGLLQFREIVDLDFEGKLVVLSACRSASGTLLAGEGVMGLSRAFFQAGARAVVGSLWPLRDDEAARLFDGFYRHLSQGLSVAAALSRAQLDMEERGFPAAAWAGVVLLGDGAMVPFPGGLPQPFPLAIVLSISIALLALAVGFGSWHRSRSHRCR